MSELKKVATIQIVNLKKVYKTKNSAELVLNDITTKFTQNNSYAITGASGSGKSTLLSLLGQLDKPSSGSIILSTPVHFGFIFQNHHLVEELNILENILLAARLNGMSYDIASNKALQLLEKVHLLEVKDKHPSQLSGGQNQRAAVVRAVISQPDFILADEPTGSLDEHSGQTVLNLLIKMHQSLNCGLIICTHDPLVYRSLDHRLHLENGKLKPEAA